MEETSISVQEHVELVLSKRFKTGVFEVLIGTDLYEGQVESLRNEILLIRQ